MGVEMCTRCDAHVDLDWNTNGAYLNETRETAGDYVCGHCLTEPELDKIEEDDNDTNN